MPGEPAPRLRSLTATCIPTYGSAGCLQKGPGLRRTQTRPSNNYFRFSDDWSTVMPPPMVELTDTFCR
jgi:hypothetical protein